MAKQEKKMLRPDAKGRISLGSLAYGVSGFAVSCDEHNRIILEPHIEIPAREQWLFKNEKALKQVKQGLKDSARGKLKDKGKFDHFSDEKEPR